ncbi:MAG TPA: hypothetical protein VGS07_32295 [Thermoanaerobaculia bacterium]|jgi:hypothetical protein|nr:hypothetical protein [Thermoanaerobaculia bacterium]
MKTPDLERIRFTAQHFNDLQGLRYGVPLGLITLGWGGATLLRVAAVLGAFLLTFGARRYYRTTFGEVEMQPAGDPAELSVFNLAGPVPRIAGFRQVTPVVRHLLITAGTAVFLFACFQSIPPNIVVLGTESQSQHPQVLREPASWTSYGPSFLTALPHGGTVRPPSMLRAVVAQTMYVLYGSFFLGFWLWRGRRRSEHYLAFAVLLLGLSALGTALGYVAQPDGEIARIFDLFLPALVYPGVAVLLCGSAMVLAGLFDHWQFVAALGPTGPQEED